MRTVAIALLRPSSVPVMTSTTMNAQIGTLPRHYERLGLVPNVIQPWEDGLRTAAADGTFEWWYFDAHLDDGSTVTVEFHTKPPYVSPSAPLTPFVLLTRTAPDGTRVDHTYIADPAQFVAATADCDVTIGPNTFRRDADGPNSYAIHVQIDDMVADFTLRPEVPPWRPETGHAFFGEREEQYIAWLPIVSRGAVDAVLTTTGTDGRTEHRSGTGYHDHNWGNIAPRKVLDHWYWGRARVGEYTVVTLMFVSHRKYDYAQLPAVMVAKDGAIIASAVGAERVGFADSDVVNHESTGVPVARRLEYEIDNADARFVVIFEHRRDVSNLDFGAAGAYLRFTGDVSLEHHTRDGVSTVSGETLWELLYFGDRTGSPSAAQREALIGHQA
jgi:predicted secreted hydrolase